MASSGKPSGVPSLSALQAQLRKGKPTPTAAPPGTDSPTAAGGVKRVATDGLAGSPSKKRVIAQPSKSAVTKQPAISKTPAITKTAAVAKTPGGLVRRNSVQGLSAKTPGGAPAPAPPPPPPREPLAVPMEVGEVAPLMVAKAPIAKIAKGFSKKLSGSQPPPPAAATPGSFQLTEPSESASTSISVDAFVASMEALPAAAKQKQVVELAETLGHSLQVDHVLHFLRTLKKSLVDRADQQGIQAHSSKAPPVMKTAAPQSTPRTPGAVAPAEGAVVKSASLASSIINKTVASKAAAFKSASISKTPPPAAATQVPAAAAATVAAPATQQLPTKAAAPGKAPVAKSVPKAPVVKAVVKTMPQSLETPPIPASAEASMEALAAAGLAAGSPPASPPPSEDGLYAVIGEIAEDPVVQDGLIREKRLIEVVKRLWDGVARKPKDWIPVWQSMSIPVDRQPEALEKLLNFAFAQSSDAEKAPSIVAELVKGHKVKMKSVEEVLCNFAPNIDSIVAKNEEAWHTYSRFLTHIFPKPAAAGWGWSRVGWSWQSWWQFTERCIQTLEASRAFEVVGLILKLIQDREGQPLPLLQAWVDGDRFAKVLAKLCDLGGCEQADVVERLSLLGVVATDEDGGQEEPGMS